MSDSKILKFPHCVLRGKVLLLSCNVQTWAPECIISKYTVWTFHDFPITQILCEINSRDSRNAEFAISTHLEALNFHLCEFLHFLNTEIYQINKIQSP